RYADCNSLLRDPRASSDETNSSMWAAVEEARPEIAGMYQRMRPFLFLDPPDHTRLRGLVSKAFTPKYVENLRPRVEQLVDQLLDAAEENGDLEVVEDYAYPLPVVVISELLGVP